MKVFKKIASVAMAAVLALGMLTACGSTTEPELKLAALVSASKTSGKSYLELSLEECSADLSASFRVTGKIALNGTTFLHIDGTNYIGEVSGTLFEKEYDTSWNKSDGVWLQEYRTRVDNMKSLIPTEAMLTQVTVNPKYQFQNNVTCYAEVVSIQNKEIAYGFEGSELKYIKVTYANGYDVVYTATFQPTYLSDVEQAMNEVESYYQSCLT